MRILTHPAHTAWEYEFAKTDHEIFTVKPDDFIKLAADGWGMCRGTLTGGPVWDIKNRPFPANVKIISLDDALRMHFDACIVHTLGWLEKLRGISCPLILKVHVMPPSNFIPEWAEEIIAAITFNGEIAMNNVVTKRGIFKNVIPVPVDSSVFYGYVGNQKRCLSIANLIRTRPEKNLNRLNKITSLMPVDLVGGGNEGIPYARGEAQSFEELVSFYQNYAVFLDVADHLSMSTLEAMITGMPIVIFPLPRNYRWLFENGENCVIVKTEKEAAEAILELFNDPMRRKKLGRNARSSVCGRFDAEVFRREWNHLLKRVVRESKKKE